MAPDPGPSDAASRTRWGLRLFELVLLLGAGVACWTAVTGGTVLELPFGTVSLTHATNPLKLLAAGVALDLWLRGALQAAVREARRRLSEAPALRRAGMLLSLVAAALVVPRYVLAPAALPAEGLRFQGLFDNEANRHVADLVYQVVSCDSSRAPVVFIHDDDPRGHLASFYVYPRAIRMEPETRRWSLGARVVRYWGAAYDDPGFDPVLEPPEIDASRALADSLGTSLLVAPGKLIGFHPLQVLRDPDPDAPSFVRIETLAGLHAAESARALSWSDENGDGFPDLVLEPWDGSEHRTYVSRGGLYFDQLPRSGDEPATRGAAGPLSANGGRSTALRAWHEALAGSRPGQPDPALGDLDGDGDLDAVVPLGTAGSSLRLLLDRGDGVPVEATVGSGLEVGGTATGCVLGDVDRDGRLDVLAVRSDAVLLLRNLGGGTFVDVTSEAGLGNSAGLYGRVDVRMADFDNDGWLDLFVSLGSSEAGRSRPDRLLLNDRKGGFVDATERAYLVTDEFGEFSRVATCDYDRDGHLDLALSGGCDAERLGAPVLLRNRSALSDDARERRSLAVEVVDARGDSELAVGLRVRTTSGAVIVCSASDLAGQDGSEALAHVGLGGADGALDVEVLRIDGTIARRQGAPAGSIVALPGVAVRGRLVSSHPAALVGEQASFALAAAEARLRERWGDRPLPPTDETDLDARIDELLAWLEARRIASEVEVDELDVARVYQQDRRLSVVPDRHLLQLVTFGPSPALAGRASADAASGGRREVRWWSTQAVASRLGARALRLVEEGSGSGFIPLAPISGGPDGATAGPAPGGLGVALSEGGGLVERRWIEAQIRHMLRLETLRIVLQDAADGRREGHHGFIERVRYSVAGLAAAARQGGLDRTRAVRRALERIRREAVLDAAARVLADEHEPTKVELARRVDRLLELWSKSGEPLDAARAGLLAREELRREHARVLVDELLGWRVP